MKTSSLQSYILDRIKYEQSKRKKSFLVQLPTGAGKENVIAQLLFDKYFRKYKGEYKQKKMAGITLIITDRPETLASLKESLERRGVPVEHLNNSLNEPYHGKKQVFIDTDNTLKSVDMPYHIYSVASTVIVFGVMPVAKELERILEDRLDLADQFVFTDSDSRPDLFTNDFVNLSFTLSDVISPFDIQTLTTDFPNGTVNLEKFPKFRDYLNLLPEGFFTVALQTSKQSQLGRLNFLYHHAGFSKVANEDLRASAGDVLKYIDSAQETLRFNNSFIQAYNREVKNIFNAIIKEYGND